MFTRGYLHLGLAPREFSDSRLLIVSHISAAIWPLHDLQKAVSAGLEKPHRKLKAGWFQPSAIYESQLGSLFPIIIWKNKTCSKPPTRKTSPKMSFVKLPDGHVRTKKGTL
jgi:hypothetical protein